MPKYLVGADQNAWDFMPAVNAAKDGDVIEFQEGYCPDVDCVVIEKNLTFIGKTNVGENGTQNFTNVIHGRVAIKNKANVTFENLWIRYGKEQTNLMNCKQEATVTLNNVVLECVQQEGEVYPILYGGDQAHLILKDVTVMENDKLYMRAYMEDGNLELDGCNFRDCRIVTEDAELKINNSSIYTGDRNAINVVDSTVHIENSTITGCEPEKDYPALWMKNSLVTTKNCVISQPDFDAAVFGKENARFESESDEMTSIKMLDGRAFLHGSTINETILADEQSSVCIFDEVRILGQNSQKVDMFIGDHSIVYGDKVSLSRITDPNIRISDHSILQLNDLVYTEGNVSELGIEADDTSRVAYQKKTSGASGISGDTDAGEDETPKESAREQLEHLIGLNSVKREIEKMLRMVEFNQQRIAKGLEPQEQSFHSVFMGNPGTGKTTVARLIGEVLFESGAFKSDEFKLIEASEPDFISQNVGGTAQQTLALLEKAKGGVLFIDEAYALNKKDANVNFGIEAINTILKYMEDHRGEIMIIFAGYTKEMEQFLKTNPGLTSRVPNKFVFEDFTPDEIVEIGEKELAKKQYKFENEEYYAQQVKRAYRGSLDHSNARWIRNFNEKLLKAFADRVMNAGEEDFETICNVDIDEVLAQGKFREEDGKHEDAMERLQKLIGIQGVKEQVSRFISLAELNQRREEQGQENSDFTLHSLFLGNPGTGKTTVARIIGEVLYQKGIISQKKFIEVSRSDLVAGYVGQTGTKTKEVLESALGGVLFIDEAYSLSQGTGNDFGIEAVNEILKFMEDHRKDIVIILAGYTKEMGEFMQMNSGLVSRVPHTFDFEDYTPDEIVQIGLLGLHNAGYQVDEAYYGEVVKNNYSKTDDHSNGRWVRNFNEKLIMAMSDRVSKAEDADLNLILNEDLDKVAVRMSGTSQAEKKPEAEPKVDENGYVLPN